MKQKAIWIDRANKAALDDLNEKLCNGWKFISATAANVTTTRMESSRMPQPAKASTSSTSSNPMEEKKPAGSIVFQSDLLVIIERIAQ